MQSLFLLIASIVVGTWNGNWFPSGRAEHRAHPTVEEATIEATAKMLVDGLRRVDPAGTNDVILCLNEIRGLAVATSLVARIGRKGLSVAVVSGYRRRDRFDQQQDVIATTLPVAEANWSRWMRTQTTVPPRGYAYAEIVVNPAVTANVYAVHLKSNYGATTAELKTENCLKRQIAIEQLVDLERKRRGRAHHPVIIAGDLNADRWVKRGEPEPMFSRLEKAGFANPLSLLPPASRGTHPSKRYGDSALDYIFCRGFEPVAPPIIVPNDGLSDHWALFVQLRLP